MPIDDGEARCRESANRSPLYHCPNDPLVPLAAAPISPPPGPEHTARSPVPAALDLLVLLSTDAMPTQEDASGARTGDANRCAAQTEPPSQAAGAIQTDGQGKLFNSPFDE